MIEHEGRFAFHMWNSFEGKMIDITIHNQLVTEINTSCIVLEEVAIKKPGKITYHAHDKLPDHYINLVESMAHEENALRFKVNRSNEEEERLAYLTEYLDTDASLIKMNRIDINDPIKPKTISKLTIK